MNRDVLIFAFFLILSFMFWYLNSLGKDIEAEVRYSVKYANLPRERMIVEDQPAKLNLFLKGPGYSILKLKVSGKRSPVIIDMAKVNYKKVPGSKPFYYYIATAGLVKSFTIQIRSGCEVTSVRPDTIFFRLEKK